MEVLGSGESGVPAAGRVVLGTSCVLVIVQIQLLPMAEQIVMATPLKSETAKSRHVKVRKSFVFVSELFIFSFNFSSFIFSSFLLVNK